MKKVILFLASLVLLAQSYGQQLATIVPVPEEMDPSVVALISHYCFPETDPKIGGFWVIGPDGSITYSHISCLDALMTNDKQPAPIHSWGSTTLPRITRIKHLTKY